jgi:hypothetical protein
LNAACAAAAMLLTADSAISCTPGLLACSTASSCSMSCGT